MKTLRAGDTPKRAAILVAARELFLAEGFDRTSVDAIAARAAVSKRTVYDYFGDKQALLDAVVEESGRSLLGAILATLDKTVPADVPGDRLEQALTDFALRISTEALGSHEYQTILRLTTRLTEVEDAPEEALAERFRTLADAGLLTLPDPRLAADHFIALAFTTPLSRLGTANVDENPQVKPMLVAGVRAFLRAYGR